MKNEVFFPAKPRRARKRKRGVTQSPAALTLTLASFDDVGPWLTLGFDRAIDIDALAGASIEVNDAFVTGFRFVGTEVATLVDPQTVRLTMIDDGPSTGTFTTLSASSASGIVAVDDGGTWEGASGLQLPFPRGDSPRRRGGRGGKRRREDWLPTNLHEWTRIRGERVFL